MAGGWRHAPGSDSQENCMSEDDENLGPCCCCGNPEGVRNIIMLDYQAAVPGTGWGCVQCGLPMNGASYVACDECVAAEREPMEAVLGYSQGKRRELIKNVYARQRHAHDMTKHPEA
jgi:hypothetical protein